MTDRLSVGQQLVEERARTVRLNRYVIFLCCILAVLAFGACFGTWVIFDQRQSLSEVESNQDRARRERLAFQCQIERRLGMDERSCP